MSTSILASSLLAIAVIVRWFWSSGRRQRAGMFRRLSLYDVIEENDAVSEADRAELRREWDEAHSRMRHPASDDATDATSVERSRLTKRHVQEPA